MKELHSIQDLEQARTVLNPTRVSLLHFLREPMTCADLARELDMSQQRVNNHLKELLKVGLIEKVESRQKRSLMEAVYQAVGRVVWLSPTLTREKSKQRLQDQTSLHNLLEMSERLQNDAAVLLSATETKHVPSIGLTAEVSLKSETERDAFTKDLVRALHSVLEKYQSTGKNEERYTAMMICYPAAD